MFLALVMVVSITPYTGALIADETRTDQTVATESEETSAPKATKKQEAEPSKEKPEKKEEPEAEPPKSSEETEAETSKETEAAKETEKPAAETPDETEEPSGKAPVESDKPKADGSETNSVSKSIPDESDSKEANESQYAEITNVKFENGIMSWDAFPGAKTYELWVYYRDSLLYLRDLTGTSIELNKQIDIAIKKGSLNKAKDNKYEIQLYAYGNSTRGEYTGTYTYKSSAVRYKKGKISGVKYSNGKLTWSKYSGASKYVVKICLHTMKLELSSNSCEINQWIDQLITERKLYYNNSYIIEIYAYDKDNIYMAQWSGTIKYQSKAVPYEVPALNASIEGDTLKVNGYEGANSYEIRIVGPDLNYDILLLYDIDNESVPINNCHYDLREMIRDEIHFCIIKEFSSYTLELTAWNTKTGELLAEWIGTYKYKEPNTLKVSSKKAKVKYNKKKNKTVKRASAIKITDKGQGRITYKKISGNSKFTINSKTGNITIKKKLKKKTYTIKVKVIAAGDDTYARLEKVLTIKIKLK